MNTDLTGSAPMLRRVSQDRHAGAGWSRHRGLVTAIAVFALLLATVAALGNGGLSYFDLSFLASGGATLAIAAMGATLVILTGGFDLSAGAVISLVNVALALGLAGGASASPLALTAAGIAIGMAAGAFNGFFVAVLRLQPIVVTLSTMFILQGATLLIMDKPGGAVAPALAEFYMGDAVPGLVPMPLALLATLGLAWAWFKRTRAGWPCTPSAATPNRRGPQDCGSTRRASWPMSWPAGCTGWPACSSARRPARVIRWWAIRCCCRCSRPWWWAARGWAAAGAGPWARCSVPTS